MPTISEQTLEPFELFSRLSASQRRKLAVHSSLLQFQPGTSLGPEGSEFTTLQMMIEGRARIEVRNPIQLVQFTSLKYL